MWRPSSSSIALIVTVLLSGRAQRDSSSSPLAVVDALSKEEMAVRQKILALRDKGVSEVGHTAESSELRNYHLRKKKRKGLLIKKEASLAEILFPGVTPELYQPNDSIYMITDLVQSKKTHVPFAFYDLPTCPPPVLADFRKFHAPRKNLGARLQGAKQQPAHFPLRVLQNVTCQINCQVDMKSRTVKWMRNLVERQYRAHLSLDQLPVLMRSHELHYAVRGYPVGFKAPPQYTGQSEDEYFLYNHLKFTITYQEAASNDGGVYITGFDVLPVSIAHQADGSTCLDSAAGGTGPVNHPTTYLALKFTGDELPVHYSFAVEWVRSELPWADRWDVYLLNSSEDDIHLFAIINSLMIVLFLTGAIATIMIRALRKDISHYNDMENADAASEETGWKLLHGDVFRPPAKLPMMLAVLVGTGAQIGSSFLLVLLCAMTRLVNPVKKGHTLTAILVLFVLSGAVAGYVSARICKFCDAKNWKLTTIATATALPGVLVLTFTVLNVFLSFAGAATAVSFLTLLAVFALWVCVSMPLVFVGSVFGFRADKIEVPVKTNQISRVVPPSLPWYATPPLSYLMGGVLPFGSVCIELFFIMSALWLHQIYYVMGFLLAVLLILAATCAQVSIVMDYLQLCSEDYRWWWKSFWNCASAGAYLFLYSLWFLVSRLELVGFLPVLVYLTYMSMISLCFGLFCGSVGFLCAFWFNRTIYGAVKVD
jgi:transmembrane 9 superfamily member 2/4